VDGSDVRRLSLLLTPLHPANQSKRNSVRRVHSTTTKISRSGSTKRRLKQLPRRPRRRHLLNVPPPKRRVWLARQDPSPPVPRLLYYLPNQCQFLRRFERHRCPRNRPQKIRRYPPRGHPLQLSLQLKMPIRLRHYWQAVRLRARELRNPPDPAMWM
jgi:hypothetical protein